MQIRRTIVDGDIAAIEVYDSKAKFIPYRLQLIEADMFDVTLFEIAKTVTGYIAVSRWIVTPGQWPIGSGNLR